MFNKEVVIKCAKEYDSFYLYDESKIIEYTNQLKEKFNNVEFLYSNKSNPYPMILKTVFLQGFGSDSASLAEVISSSNHGLTKEKIYYSAPGKSMEDIHGAMDISVIVADSLDEILRIQEVAKEKGVTAKIGIRINPNFGFYSDKGIASKFGIDEEIIFENGKVLKKLENVEITGIHVHVRSQELQAEVIWKYYERILNLAKKVQKELDINLEFINLGSGIGINYSVDDNPLDTTALGSAAEKLIVDLKRNMPQVTVFIETGRFAVTKSGVYATKVVDIKQSYGKTFVILKNTLNGFIRPSLAQLISSYSSDESPAGSEPLFTSVNAFDFIALTDESQEEVVSLVGNLCTGTDVVAKDILMPKLKCGDVVVMTNAGSYAAVLSPMQFSSQVPPAQLFLSVNGEIVE